MARASRSLSIYMRCLISSSRIPYRCLVNLTPSNQTSSSSIMEPKFSAGADEGRLRSETKTLLEGGWGLDGEQLGVQKTYYFKTYTKALDFLQTIGIRSKSKNHHSVMTIKSGSVHVHWMTYNPRGLSAKDTFMARFCDEQARLIGTVDEIQAQKCVPAPTSQI